MALFVNFFFLRDFSYFFMSFGKILVSLVGRFFSVFMLKYVQRFLSEVLNWFCRPSLFVRCSQFYAIFVLEFFLCARKLSFIIRDAMR